MISTRRNTPGRDFRARGRDQAGRRCRVNDLAQFRQMIAKPHVIGIQQGKDGDKNETRFYNGVTLQEMGDAYGLKKLGIEKCKPFFTRAHLIDVAGLKGQMWDAGQEIKLADVRAASLAPPRWNFRAGYASMSSARPGSPKRWSPENWTRRSACPPPPSPKPIWPALKAP